MGRKWYGYKWIRPDKRLAIHLRDEFTCRYCYKDLHNAEPGDLQLDHLVSVHYGGHNGETNLITACRACNRAKEVMPWRAFIRQTVRKEYEGLRNVFAWSDEVHEHQIKMAADRRIRDISNRRRRKLRRDLAKALLRGCTCSDTICSCSQTENIQEGEAYTVK